MGEQQIQQETGLLCKTQADRTADSVKQDSSTNKQDSADVEEKLQWKRATQNNKFIRNLESLLTMYAHTVLNYHKEVEKQIKKIKRF
jgi:hypothetical protein